MTLINSPPKSLRNLSLSVFLLYALIETCNALFGVFLPLYYNSLGYSLKAIGVLAALMQGSAIIAQLFWGPASDRARYKNTILILATVCSTIIVAVFRLSHSIWFVGAMIILYSALRSPSYGLCETLALEYANDKRYTIRYSIARTGGPIGFALSAAITGYFLKESIGGVFTAYVGAGIVLSLLIFSLPKVEGYQHTKKKKVPIKALLEDKALLVIVLLCCVLNFGNGYFNSYSSLYMQEELGATTFIIGLSSFIGAGSEIPLLILMNTLVGKFKISTIFLGCTLITGIRWILISAVRSPWMLLALQPMHSAILFASVLSAVLISQSVPDELKASSQIYFTLLTAVVSIMASLLGGYVTSFLGYRMAFIFLGSLTLVCFVLWKLVLFRRGLPEKVLSGL